MIGIGLIAEVILKDEIQEAIRSIVECFILIRIFFAIELKNRYITPKEVLYAVGWKNIRFLDTFL